MNTAKTRGQREARSVPFSSVWAPDADEEPSVDPDRFLPAEPIGARGRWARSPPVVGDDAGGAAAVEGDARAR